MSIRDKFIGWMLGPAFEKAAREWQKGIGSDVYGSIMKYLGSSTPAYIPDDYAGYINQGYLYNPTVYSIVSFIAQKAATIPWMVYNVKSDNALKLLKSAGPEISLKSLALRKKALEENEGHELNQLFKRVNPLQSWSDFIEQAIGFKLVTGNSYLHVIGPEGGSNAGKISEIWTLPSQIVKIIASGDKAQPVERYELTTDSSVKIPPGQIIHLKYWTPEYADGAFLYGLSPIRAGRRPVSKSNASYDAGTAAMQNSGMLGFISAADGVNEAPLTTVQATALQKRLKEYSKASKRGEIPVTASRLKWNQMGMSPVDLAMIEADKMDLRTLCNIYHIASEIFNDPASKTYASAKEARKAAYTDAIIPGLVQLRDSLNQFIDDRGIYGDNIYVDFDASAIPEMQEDLQTTITALSSAWWLKANEKRSLTPGFGEDMDEPLMEEYFIPSGIIPISQLGQDTADEVVRAAVEEVEKNWLYGSKAR